MPSPYSICCLRVIIEVHGRGDRQGRDVLVGELSVGEAFAAREADSIFF